MGSLTKIPLSCSTQVNRRIIGIEKPTLELKMCLIWQLITFHASFVRLLSFRVIYQNISVIILMCIHIAILTIPNSTTKNVLTYKETSKVYCNKWQGRWEDGRYFLKVGTCQGSNIIHQSDMFQHFLRKLQDG